MVSERVTLRDIARLAEVSHMTVSRALNNDPSVRRETKQRILKLAKELNYRPHANARALASRKSHLIGLIVSDISNPFYAELARGIEDKARERGYNVIFCSTDDRPERTRSHADFMREMGVDGLIFASVRLHESAVEELIRARFPLVLVNRRLQGDDYNYVTCNNFKGAYDITKHLLKLGYSKIAAITGSPQLWTGIERLKGYRKALADHGIKVERDYVIQGSFTGKTGYEGAKRLLALRDRPEAIFAGNDYMAMGVMNAVDELGMAIPEDVALVGFDDTDFASHLRTKLTTVSQRKYEMGNLGVQILIDYIERKEKDYVHKVVLEPRLIIRESCGQKLKGRERWSGKASF